jgi:Domain of unknown function (DUF4328)
VLATIAFLVWVYHANRNARALGAEGMEFSPGWSVGWFFVPLAGLVMPFRVVREIWKASTPEAGKDWKQQPVSALVGVWWAVSLVQILLHYSPFQVVFGNKQIGDLYIFFKPDSGWIRAMHDFSWGLLIADLVEVAGCVLTVALIICITGSQQRRQMLRACKDEQPIGGAV